MLRPVDQALHHFRASPSWQRHRQLEVIKSLWPEIVGQAVVAHTRPLQLQRQVLSVAVSNPAWAQNLAFQRRLLLQKLNAHLHQTPIQDIRFLPGAWHERAEATLTWPAADPRFTASSPAPKAPSAPPATSPHEAFDRWAKQVKQQQKDFSPCPLCHRPSPAHELSRWYLCGPCHIQNPLPQVAPSPAQASASSPPADRPRSKPEKSPEPEATNRPPQVRPKLRPTQALRPPLEPPNP